MSARAAAGVTVEANHRQKRPWAELAWAMRPRFEYGTLARSGAGPPTLEPPTSIGDQVIDSDRLAGNLLFLGSVLEDMTLKQAGRPEGRGGNCHSSSLVLPSTNSRGGSFQF